MSKKFTDDDKFYRKLLCDLCFTLTRRKWRCQKKCYLWYRIDKFKQMGKLL